MKLAYLLCLAMMFSACMMSPRFKNASRPSNIPQDQSDLASLEQLILKDHMPSVLRVEEPENLRLGMRRNRVKRALGLPDQVEVAGNPEYGNERWIYQHSVPTPDGYSYDENKIIYFEDGAVVGWESN